MTPSPEQSGGVAGDGSDYIHLHYTTAQSKQAQLLRESPRTGEEIQKPNPGPLRKMVCRLTAPGARDGGDAKYRSGTRLSIYYLYGDERRAVRRFIDVNEDYVQSCLNDTNNPLATNWDDVLYQLLREEWDFRTAENRSQS